jgi:hypothetical protein
VRGEVFTGPIPKPQRGSWKLEREQRKSGNDAEELAAKKAAKAQDGRCRWPERHKCRGGLEGAHVIDKSRGGGECAGEHPDALRVDSSERAGVHSQQGLSGAAVD